MTETGSLPPEAGRSCPKLPAEFAGTIPETVAPPPSSDLWPHFALVTFIPDETLSATLLSRASPPTALFRQAEAAASGRAEEELGGSRGVLEARGPLGRGVEMTASELGKSDDALCCDLKQVYVLSSSNN